MGVAVTLVVGGGVGGEVLPGVVDSTQDEGREIFVQLRLGEKLDEAVLVSVRMCLKSKIYEYM